MKTNAILLSSIVSLASATESGSTQDERLFWGTYRPYPYVGLRSRSPQSPLVGLMWYKPSLHDTGLTQIRHECSYYDHMELFGWQKHNGESFAAQDIVDPENNVELNVHWVKPDVDNDPNHWVLRVEGSSLNTTDPSTMQDISLMWYLSTPENLTATYDSHHITGEQPDMGKYFLSFQEGANNTYPEYLDLRNNTVKYDADYFYALTIDQQDEYDPKKYYFMEIHDDVASTPHHLFNPDALYRAETAMTGNQLVRQKFFTLPFQMDIHFAYRETPFTPEDMDFNKTSFDLEFAEDLFDSTFEQRFINTTNSSSPNDQVMQNQFSLATKFTEFLTSSSDIEKSDKKWSDEMVAAGKFALSNMLGSMTYSYGDRMIFDDNGQVVSEEPTSLFAVVPDRPDHAHAFMWDEGFQQHLVSVWNLNLTMEIIASWFNQTNQETGWIAREQMLGRESRWPAPPSSWPQIPGTANPPSQHLLLDNLLNRFDSQEQLKDEKYDEFVEFLSGIYHNLKLNVEWFISTQSSDLLPNTFRWKGRTLAYCLPSGMDDYPRAPILTEEEAHLDLQVWMIVSSRAIQRIATILNQTEDAAHYQSNVDAFTKVLNDNFWDADRELYDDIYKDENGDMQFDGHIGYLNFWPFFLNAIEPSDPRFETTARKLIDPDFGVWTPYGIASLSKNDPYYKMQDDYWTSPIWMNINFLITKALHGYGQDQSVEQGLRDDIQTAYGDLRQNLIDMIVGEYTRTGFIWEVYNDDTGAGMDNHPFTGWSALIANLLAEIY